MLRIIKSAFLWGSLLMLVACSVEKTELISDVQEGDANDVVAALLGAGIDAEKAKLKKSLSVMIAKRDMSAAMEVLNAKGLPNRQHTNLGEIFKKEGMVSTPLEERARYIYGLSQELEYTISQIDGVLVARVHVVLPERVSPGQPIQPPSAAILVKHLPFLDPDSISSKIKRVVTSSIPGLNGGDLDHISLSFVESQIQAPELKLVKVGKYVLTEKSAKDLRQTMFWAAVIGVLFVVTAVAGGAAYYFFIFRKKKAKAAQSNKAPQSNKANSDDSDVDDFFNGEEITP